MAPKMNAELAAASLSTEEKERLDEVADLLLRIYKTLVDMRYVPAEAVIEGPHTLSDEILRTYEECELSPCIIYLYSILPYIDQIETYVQDFFQGGTFFNPLNKTHVTRGRDPRYLSPEGGFDEENGKYMYPWYTPLSECGNHYNFLVYDAKRHVIWIVDQIEGSTTDPAFRKWHTEADSVKAQSDWGESESSDDDWVDESDEDAGEAAMSDDDDASCGSSEFWDDNDDQMVDTQEIEGMVADQDEEMDYEEGFEQIEELEEWERSEAALAELTNKNSLDAARHRPAREVLEDIDRWYHELKEFPGQGEHSAMLEPKILKPLYLKCGWPDRFDGDNFEVEYARVNAQHNARYGAEEPLREVECLEGWIKGSEHDLKRCHEDIAKAKTIDDEWLARIKIWEAQESIERNGKELKEARETARKLCPEGVCQKASDLPLWELEQLRVVTQHKREAVEYNSTPSSTSVSTDAERSAKAQHRRALREVEVYKKAFQASKADAQRLCPGRTFEEATGIKSLGRRDTLTQIGSDKEIIEYYERIIPSMRSFASTIPQAAKRAVTQIEKKISDCEKSLQSTRTSLERNEKWLAEKGNTD
ncbi:unnamed protein product [Periconia digitata]|uniref:Uncharacterized protein n=1 Tax=Periconia digitata TaxID=1303443 RepID=A0A9W4U5G7_9PLEO|nr:unnamed protein product [Periconia digitata]